jgi:hypothetical protein
MTEDWIQLSYEMGDDLQWIDPSACVDVRATGGDHCENVLAQIDPAAGTSLIHSALSEKLGCAALPDRRLVHMATKVVMDLPVVSASFRFPKGGEIHLDCAVGEMGDPHQVLLGRDFLRACKMSIDFISGKFVLHIGAHILGCR